ncbi:hypothetical protein BDZ97DRAFT_723826 [Flammula alnicola]|nr:hypothetical protein BDZ97DRAFT_723826 [Flammula alnicola]
MSQGYYQLGGFRPQIQWFRSTYDDKSLAQAIAGPSSPLRVTQNPNDPVEVVLGIKRHGSSHLLLTVEQTQSFARAMALPLPNPRVTLAPREFESLSPITFSNVEAFTKKLSVLKPKAKKPGDSSQANRGYNDGRDNLYRGGFEHGRVLYRILGDMIDANTYGVEDTYWAENLRIRSLVFNTKGVDDRPAAERLKNPSILDIGICDATLPTLIPDYSSARHIIHSGNILLGRKGPKKPFIYGNSEIVTAAMMPHRIQENFKEFQKATEKPMVLLVNREEETVNFLRNMGVDVSAWQRYGLRDLLIPKNSQVSLTIYK